jgi:hypothetical protein
MKKIFSIVLFLSLLGSSSDASAQQVFIGASAAYDNSFREWAIDVDDDDFEVSIKQRWQMQNDWTEWDVDFNGKDAAIRQKWKNNPAQWELRMDKEIITMKTRWNNDFNEWLISDGKTELILETSFPGQPQEWVVKKSDLGRFKMFMFYQNDPRDWEIEDALKEEVSDAMRLAITFTVLINSCPKK